MLRWTTKLNTVGPQLAKMPGVHAVTDVTGFGLAGHLLEICRGSQLQAQLEFDRIPFIDIALQLAQDGYATGAAARNWASYGESVTLESHIAEWQRKLLCDPQTSGGLLVSCTPETVDAVLAAFNADGFNHAAVIGVMQAGSAQVSVG
jgi:selenide,water dikinase